MAWTTPRTWATNELVTAALMNTHVKDNLDYLKLYAQAVVGVDIDIAGGSTTSTSYVDSNLTVAVTLPCVCDVLVLAVFRAYTTATGKTLSWQIERDGTVIGSAISVLSATSYFYDTDIGTIALFVIDTAAPAAAYTYALQYKTNDAARANVTLNGSLAVIAIPKQ